MIIIIIVHHLRPSWSTSEVNHESKIALNISMGFVLREFGLSEVHK